MHMWTFNLFQRGKNRMGKREPLQLVLEKLNGYIRNNQTALLSYNMQKNKFKMD